MTVSTDAVENLTASRPIDVRGTVRPGRQAFVSTRVTGPVIAVHVTAGSRVASGPKLLDIQPEATEGQLAQATGALAQAEAALSLAERNYRRFEALHGEGSLFQFALALAPAEGALGPALL